MLQNKGMQKIQKLKTDFIPAGEKKDFITKRFYFRRKNNLHYFSNMISGEKGFSEKGFSEKGFKLIPAMRKIVVPAITAR